MAPSELRALRRTHGLTQRALAHRLGYHVNYIACLERGVFPLTPRVVRLVQVLFNCPEPIAGAATTRKDTHAHTSPLTRHDDCE